MTPWQISLTIFSAWISRIAQFSGSYMLPSVQQLQQTVLPSGMIRLKKLATGPGVGARVGFWDGGFPVPLVLTLQSSERTSRLLVQSAKYMSRNTSNRNQIRDVTMTTLSVNAVRRFILIQVPVTTYAAIAPWTCNTHKAYYFTGNNILTLLYFMVLYCILFVQIVGLRSAMPQ